MGGISFIKKIKEKGKLPEDIFKENLEGKTCKKIAKEYNISPSTVWRFFKNNNITPIIHQPRKIKIKESIFHNIDTPEKAYWLGFIAADGSNNLKQLGFTLNISKRDLNHLKKFAEFIDYHISKIHTVTNQNMVYVRLRNKRFISDLHKLGMVPNKCRTLEMPDIPYELKRYWITGFWDGDGSVHCDVFDSIITNIASESKKIIEDVKEYIIKNANMEDKKIYVYNHKSANAPIYSLQWRGHDSVKVLNYIYPESIRHIAMERKYSIFDVWYERRGYTLRKTKTPNFDWNPTKTELEEQHINKRLCTKQIGEIFNIDSETVRRRLHKFGIGVQS